MEEYDDLTEGPDPSGSLNLSHNQWQSMPHELYSLYSKRLLYLTLSHNRLTEVSCHIQKLTLLKELNLSHNRIEKMDVAIGFCKRLRKLDVSFNLLEELPMELGRDCVMLDTLLLNDNKLLSLPELNLPALERLDLRNNDLKSIPFNLCLIECLQQIPCDGNPNLSTIIPTAMQNDSSLVLWTLSLHQRYDDKIQSTMKEYQDMLHIAEKSETEKLKVRAEEREKVREVDLLREDYETSLKFYLEMKGRWKKKLEEGRVGLTQWVEMWRMRLESMRDRVRRSQQRRGRNSRKVGYYFDDDADLNSD